MQHQRKNQFDFITSHLHHVQPLKIITPSVFRFFPVDSFSTNSIDYYSFGSPAVKRLSYLFIATRSQHELQITKLAPFRESQPQNSYVDTLQNCLPASEIISFLTI